MRYIIGVLIIIADIWAIVNIVEAPRPSFGAKILWILLILFFPVVGLIIWFFAGPQSARP